MYLFDSPCFQICSTDVSSDVVCVKNKLHVWKYFEAVIMRVSNNCFELSSCIIGDTATRPYSWGRTPLPHERPHLADFCPFETVKCAFSFCQLLKISYFIRTVFDSIRFISFVLSRLFQLEVLLTTVPPPHPTPPLSVSVCPSSLSGEVGEVLQPPALLQVQSGLRGAQRWTGGLPSPWTLVPHRQPEERGHAGKVSPMEPSSFRGKL